jgi:hypothetical protein
VFIGVVALRGAPSTTRWPRRGVGTVGGVRGQITAWVAGDGDQRPVTITKIHTLLARRGNMVPYRTLNRFAGERCGFGAMDTTVRVVDGIPGWNARLIAVIRGC